MPIRPLILEWDPDPPEQNVTHYNAYEHLADGTYFYLGYSTTTCYFQDESGQTPGDHFYVVTAVDDQNRESAFSNEVCATVYSWRIK